MSNAQISYAGLAADDVGRSDDRPPLVLLHGLTFDRTMWRPALAELERIDPGRRAIALDLPGHGESPDASSYTVTAVAEHVRRAVDDAGLERPVVIGHSGSAGVAFVYAALFPTRGVVTVEGTLRVSAFARMAQPMEPILRGPAFATAWERIAATSFGLDEVSDGVRAFVNATSRPRQDIVLGYWQELFERTPDELDAMVFAGAAAVRRAGVPMVAVMGHAPSPEDAAWARANELDSRTLIWPASGHFPHLAHPDEFARLLMETAAWSSEPVAEAV